MTDQNVNVTWLLGDQHSAISTSFVPSEYLVPPNMSPKQFARHPKNSKQGKSNQPVEVKPTRHLRVTEREHDDTEPIDPNRFPWAELIPNWSELDPNTKNPSMDKKFTKGHHVPHGDHGKKKKDFEKFTFGFCLEWILDTDGTWVRCCNTFTTDSNQCTVHGKTTHKDGCTQIWKLMKDGKTGYWGMLKNRNVSKEVAPMSVEQQNRLEYEQMEEEVRRRVDDGEDFDDMFDELKADYDEKKELRQKISRQQAREKSVMGSRETSVAAPVNPDPRKAGNGKSVASIPALQTKATRNPNQRGKGAVKAATAASSNWQTKLPSLSEDVDP
ncbi:hypothetical protein CC86DRAFT_459646 [Ophiobolus disseminans]|uniref:Uncharacterized protein n=1 Tax=Ophiobolus disseminans TaxID=1469910 RepID=A0A6A6ZIW6_9PLEO|nr:hypothetical protein CC86DRAFT_459646 [Ophiobolus disseminans]